MIASRSELADVLGVALGTVDQYARDGMPEEPSAGRQRRFDTASCIRWLLGRDRSASTKVELDEVELRAKRAQAGLREIELSERERTMLHVSDLVMLMDEQFSIIKSQLEQLPARIAHRVAVEADPATCRLIVREEVHRMYEAMQSQQLAERLTASNAT